ncbi:MAG: helix-turn-helix transcriptional regulator [Bacteroidota bacterium]
MIRNTVKQILKNKGMTQSDLAEKLGTTQETVSRQLGGNPTLKTLTEIATALEVDIRELFTSTTDKGGIYGFVEFDDKVHTVRSQFDLEKLLELLKSQK